MHVNHKIVFRSELLASGIPSVVKGRGDAVYRFLLTDDGTLVFGDVGDHCTLLGRAGFPEEATRAPEIDCVMLAAAWGKRHVIAAGCLDADGNVTSWESKGLQLATLETMRGELSPHLHAAFHSLPLGWVFRPCEEHRKNVSIPFLLCVVELLPDGRYRALPIAFDAEDNPDRPEKVPLPAELLPAEERGFGIASVETDMSFALTMVGITHCTRIMYWRDIVEVPGRYASAPASEGSKSELLRRSCLWWLISGIINEL